MNCGVWVETRDTVIDGQEVSVQSAFSSFDLS